MIRLDPSTMTCEVHFVPENKKLAEKATKAVQARLNELLEELKSMDDDGIIECLNDFVENNARKIASEIANQ